MNKIFKFIKRHKFFSLFLVVFVYYNCFADLFEEKTLRTFLGARIFVFFQKMTPLEARKLVVKEAKSNPQFKNYDHGTAWFRMFVSGDEYFFPAMWPHRSMDEYGYYVNPGTGKVRYVNNDYDFHFPFFFERCSIRFSNEERDSQ